MTDVAGHIRNLLFQHNCVVVPGLGGFVANYQPARMHPTSYIFNNPAKSIAFNVNLTANDGLLVNSLVTTEYLNIYDAEKCVSDFVAEAKALLTMGKTIKIPEVGRLVFDEELNLIFLPDPSNNLLLQSYGLRTIHAEPVLRSREQVRQALQKNEVSVDHSVFKRRKINKKLLVPAFAAVLFMAFLLQLFVQVQLKGNHYADILGLDLLLRSESVTGNAYETERLFIQDYFLKYYRPTTRITDSLLVLKAEVVNESTPIDIATELPAGNEGKYWLIAGAYGKMEFAQNVNDAITAQGYKGQVIERNELFMIAVDIDAEMSNTNFRNQFIAATGIADAWILKK